MIELAEVSKNYVHRGGGVIHALRSANVHVERGDFVAVVGPSGSGKSTLLSVLGGMLAPSAGKVLLNNKSLYDMSIKERARIRNTQLGFLFQSFNLVPWLTALENVQLPLCLSNTEPKTRRGRAMELLNQFGLADRVNHKPSELSAGQQQRVAMARTLSMAPQLILADEPTGNLDPKSRDLVLNTLRELCDSGCAIVLVTHDSTISNAAQRILSIADGNVVESESHAIPGDSAA
jgi:putative ABC transport system ATP-binding protein